MRGRFICVAAAGAMALIGLRTTAQEIIATPAPAGGANVGASADVHAAVAPTTDNWRYRWHDGRWWYWTPQNRWMWYGDDGQWVPYDANHAPPAVAESNDSPAIPYGHYSYPGPGYWGGYYYPRYYRYPGVAVGVGPYGSVGVAVGRRVGVNVWGPYGGVRVGRIYVGW